MYATFNPTMVRLQRTVSRTVLIIDEAFQSHYGAIATAFVLVVLAQSLQPFNPTMVRLQPQKTYALMVAQCRLSIPLWCDCNRKGATEVTCEHLIFQSHYGAIATMWRLGGAVILNEPFNPTMVRLQLNPNATKQKTSEDTFNPTMVRLQRIFFAVHILALTLFQSHYGAIATIAVALTVEDEQLTFNPTMVRLQHILHRHCFANTKTFQSHYGAIAT